MKSRPFQSDYEHMTEGLDDAQLVGQRWVRPRQPLTALPFLLAGLALALAAFLIAHAVRGLPH